MKRLFQWAVILMALLLLLIAAPAINSAWERVTVLVRESGNTITHSPPPVEIREEINLSLQTGICGEQKDYRIVMYLPPEQDLRDLKPWVQEAIVRFENFDAAADVKPEQFIAAELRLHGLIATVTEFSWVDNGVLTKRQAAELRRMEAKLTSAL